MEGLGKIISENAHWWHALIIGGVAAFVACAAARWPAASAASAGIALFGVGQWKDHPVQHRIGQGFKITGHPFSPSLVGIAFSCAGLCLIAYAIYIFLSY
jgi:hypothetical protein